MSEPSRKWWDVLCCRVCFATVREGLIYCGGSLKCWKEGEGIMGWMDNEEQADADALAGPPPVKDLRFDGGNMVATDVESGKTVQLTTSAPANDPLNPNHYKLGAIEVIELLEELGIAEDFCHGNLIKYAARAGAKDPATELEDFRKGKWYALKLLELVGKRRAAGAK